MDIPAIDHARQLGAASLFSHLQCAVCGTKYAADQVQDYCRKEGCDNPLLSVYRLEAGPSREVLSGRPPDMWRYRELLPVKHPDNIVSLGEGLTPLLPVPTLGKKLGLRHLYIKEEGNNPTGSFKARGLAMAISKAKEYGIQTCCIPTAGNAGSATAAYCARSGMEAVVYMPRQTPELFKKECRMYGAQLVIVDGTISDCAHLMRQHNQDGRWFDLSTLKEPYRLEGKKTMGYEIAEQMNWQTPDVVVYPTGGGTGLIGIWKAFQEMRSLGWIDPIRTRMVAVQLENCRPIVDAFEAGLDHAHPFANPGETIANGLRVPHAFGHRLILQTIRDSAGTAISVSEEEIHSGIGEIAAAEGLFVSPEGAAVWVALKRLRKEEWIGEKERVVLLNTGSAYKYAENL